MPKNFMEVIIMAHCDKCNADFDENNAEEAAKHKHEDAQQAPGSEAQAPSGDQPEAPK